MLYPKTNRCKKLSIDMLLSSQSLLTSRAFESSLIVVHSCVQGNPRDYPHVRSLHVLPCPVPIICDHEKCLICPSGSLKRTNTSLESTGQLHLLISMITVKLRFFERAIFDRFWSSTAPRCASLQFPPFFLGEGASARPPSLESIG